MNYKVGDEVICIDATPVIQALRGTGLKCGEKYTVRALFKSPCCGVDLVDVGVYSSALSTFCGCGATISPALMLNYSWRFIKLDGVAQDQRSDVCLTTI